MDNKMKETVGTPVKLLYLRYSESIFIHFQNVVLFWATKNTK
jgi:hypothetical protein